MVWHPRAFYPRPWAYHYVTIHPLQTLAFSTEGKCLAQENFGDGCGYRMTKENNQTNHATWQRSNSIKVDILSLSACINPAFFVPINCAATSFTQGVFLGPPYQVNSIDQ